MQYYIIASITHDYGEWFNLNTNGVLNNYFLNHYNNFEERTYLTLIEAISHIVHKKHKNYKFKIMVKK